MDTGQDGSPVMFGQDFISGVVNKSECHIAE